MWYQRNPLSSRNLYEYKADQIYFRRNKAPKQNRPNSRSWTLWRNLLDSLLNDNLSLKKPLGSWTKHHSTHGFWKSYIINNFVYEYTIIDNKQHWREYNINGQQLTYQQLIDFDDFDPSSATPTTITSNSTGDLYTNLTAIIPTSSLPTHQPIHSWDSLLESQPPWIQHLLEEITFSSEFPNPFEIIELYEKHGHLITVSDGSVIFTTCHLDGSLPPPKVK